MAKGTTIALAVGGTVVLGGAVAAFAYAYSKSPSIPKPRNWLSDFLIGDMALLDAIPQNLPGTGGLLSPHLAARMFALLDPDNTGKSYDELLAAAISAQQNGALGQAASQTADQVLDYTSLGLLVLLAVAGVAGFSYSIVLLNKVA